MKIIFANKNIDFVKDLNGVFPPREYNLSDGDAKITGKIMTIVLYSNCENCW